MNIAHILPYSTTFPLKTHNGRYEWVRQLALRQTAQGHQVTIYCNPASQSEGLTFRGIESAIADDKRTNNLATFELAFADSHDIYHSHFDNLHYEVAAKTKQPIVYTQHWWPTEQTIELAQSFHPQNVWAVPPTLYMLEADRTHGIQTKGCIYHGIDLKLFRPVHVKKTDRLLFVGRITPQKHLEQAIEIAEKSGIPLDIVGKISPKDTIYWERLQLRIDGNAIRYLGSKSREELVALYSSTRGLLCPFDAAEAFGLVAIEAQACGAPIIMSVGASHGELLAHGVTGFLCKTTGDFVEAVNKAVSLNSNDCVAFAKKFDIITMVKAYEALYQKLLSH